MNDFNCEVKSKILKDMGLDEREFVKLILDEDMNQIIKWGFQEHDIFRWLAFLVEEVGELSEAISEYTFRDGATEAIRKEAIQCATLALKIARMVKNEERYTRIY